MNPQHGTPWTQPEVDRLQRMWADGYTGGEIGRTIGRTRNAIMGMISRLGIQRRRTEKQQMSNDQPLRAQRKQEGDVSNKKIRLANEVLPPEPWTPRPDPTIPRHLTLMELHAGDCRWPYGQENFTFCGHAKLEGSPYCAIHDRLAFTGQRNVSLRFAGGAR